MLIGDIPRQAAAKFGAKTAVICADRRISFTELDLLADRFAAALAGRGIAAGDPVTLYGENGWAWIVAYYGILRAGGVVNPVNALLTPAEFGFIVADCGSRLIVASAACAADLADCALPIIVYGGDAPAPATGFDEFLREGGAVPSRDGDEASLSTICYTSGTTGHPKGAMLSHRSVVTNVRMTALMHGRCDRDVVVSALPCPHVYGNVVMNASVLSGATLVLFARFDASAIIDAIERHGATVVEGVPTMYYYLLAEPRFATAKLATLRLCTVGGQSMPVAKMAAVENVTNCPLIELWGMTELGGLGATHPHTGPYRHGSIGVALPFVQLRVADTDDPSIVLDTDAPGELQVQGPIVMLGYHGRPDATATAITPDGWLRTGDIARRDADGFYAILDRKSDMILTAGYNIYPAEIERVIAAHPAVAMVAVGPVADPLKGEVPRAYVVRKPGVEADADSILAHCRAVLAAYKLPRSVVFVDDLPKTSTGKIMRRALAGLETRPIEATQGER